MGVCEITLLSRTVVTQSRQDSTEKGRSSMSEPLQPLIQVPLIEAVFEIFVQPTPDIEQQQQQQRALLERFKQELDGRVEMFPVPHLQLMASQPTQLSLNTHVQTRTRLWNRTEECLVQFDSTMMSYNILGNGYQSYALHRAQLLGHLRQYQELVAPKQILYLGQRYINRVSLGQNERPEEIFSIYPRIPESMSSPHRTFAMQLQVDNLGGTGQVTVGLVYQGARDKQHLYVLDIYARSNPDIADWSTWHDAAHDAIRRVFELAIRRPLPSMSEEIRL